MSVKLDAETQRRRAALADVCQCGHERRFHQDGVAGCHCWKDCKCFSFRKAAA